MKTPDNNSIDFESVSVEDAGKVSSPAEHAAKMDAIGKRNKVNLEAPTKSEADLLTIQQLHNKIAEKEPLPLASPEALKETPESVEAKPKTVETRQESFKEVLEQGRKDIFKFLGNKVNPDHGVDGKRPSDMSSSELKRAISDKESGNESNAKYIRTAGLVGGAFGIMGGIMAPAIIGLTPALAVALPAIMTSTFAIGGVAIASSAVLLSGAGIGIAALGYGAYKLKSFFNKRSAEKAKTAASSKELDELL